MHGAECRVQVLGVAHNVFMCGKERPVFGALHIKQYTLRKGLHPTNISDSRVLCASVVVEANLHHRSACKDDFIDHLCG